MSVVLGDETGFEDLKSIGSRGMRVKAYGIIPLISVHLLEQ